MKLQILHSVSILSLIVFGVIGKETTKDDESNNKMDDKQVCFGDLGCFEVDGPWYSLLLRPTPAPQHPKEIKTKIFFFDRTTDETLVYNFSSTTNENIKFIPTRTTYFIVHGYLGSGNVSWLHEFKDTLLRKADANVFIVDWGDGAQLINYFQVASNARVVGAEMSRYINYLKSEHGLDPSKVHLIGHSLGAQVASYAAKKVPGIGRLTGLDAAQPGFEGLSKEVRIDKGDAKFVDLLHTNIRPVIPTLGFGMISAVGHVDIYFNGGLDQPGCYTPDGINNIHDLKDLLSIPFQSVAKWISCSHSKSYEYFLATIHSKCKIWARKAGKVRSIVNAVTLGKVEPITAAIGKCSEDTCTAVGLETPEFKAQGTFAATTIRKYPYCDSSDPGFDQATLRDMKTEKKNLQDNIGNIFGSIVSKV